MGAVLETVNASVVWIVMALLCALANTQVRKMLSPRAGCR